MFEFGCSLQICGGNWIGQLIAPFVMILLARPTKKLGANWLQHGITCSMFGLPSGHTRTSQNRIPTERVMWAKVKMFIPSNSGLQLLCLPLQLHPSGVEEHEFCFLTCCHGWFSLGNSDDFPWPAQAGGQSETPGDVQKWSNLGHLCWWSWWCWWFLVMPDGLVANLWTWRP